MEKKLRELLAKYTKELEETRATLENWEDDEQGDSASGTQEYWVGVEVQLSEFVAELEQILGVE